MEGRSMRVGGTRSIVIVAAFAAACFAFAVPSAARASSHNELSGWAWNAQAGWISMNRQNCVDLNSSVDPDPCALGGVDYRVDADDLGYLTGYAWSPSAGWICFGASCAGSGGATPVGGWSARIDAVSQQVGGWAKVLALGDNGWVSLSCANTQGSGCASYRTAWTPRPLTGGSGRITGHAWNGAASGSALGWIVWQPGFESAGGGVAISWDPEPRCAESGAQCTSDLDCTLLEERCCLGGADCGQCSGADRCGYAGDCGSGILCCPIDDPQCGRCVQDYSRCAGDAQCPDVAVDSCCPPGAVCTRTNPSASTVEGADPENPSIVPGTVGSAVGFCESTIATGAPLVCVDTDHCGGGVCRTEPPQGLCTTNESQACASSADCGGGGSCSVEVGVCSVNNGEVPVACLTDAYCASHGGINDASAVCSKIMGQCSATEAVPKLCAGDANCVTPGSRCEQLYLPWLQTQYGPIYSGGSVGSPQTSPPPPGEHNATYCILAGGPIINFLSEPGACGTGAEQLAQTPYTAAVARIDVRGITLGRYGRVAGEPPTASVDPRTFTTDANGVTLGGKVYLVDGDLTVGADGVVFRNGVGEGAMGAGLIVVRGGNLTIAGDVRYRDPDDPVFNVAQLASPGWLVLAGTDGSGNSVGGNITVAPDVENLVGAFYAEGEVRTGTTGSRTEAPLVVRGVMVAKSFRFERSHGSARGAEQIIADGRVLVSTPPGFGDLVQSLPYIQQIIPQAP